MKIGIIKQTKKVSIPHRYGKNERKYPEQWGRKEFPFLIGTVRTGTTGCDKGKLMRFHSS